VHSISLLKSNKILTICILVLLTTFPSQVFGQKKAGFLKRAWVNTITRYNYYFNSREMVKEADRNARLVHVDNFDEIIDLFAFSEEANLKNNLPVMDEAIKKGAHVVTRKTTSKWVDDSYLVIGKAQFYKGDFFAALESFEFVVSKYKDKPTKWEAEIWTIKTYLMLKKYDDAAALSSILMDDKKFPSKLKKELYITHAEANIKVGKYFEAYKSLTKAMPLLKARDMKYRRNYVAGQLALKNNKLDEALTYFKKVTKSNPPYEFDFHARLNIVKILKESPYNQYKKAIAVLKRMLKDEKNKEYYDLIHYELALIDLKAGFKEEAIYNLKAGLAKATGESKLRPTMYLLLAELYFNDAIYPVAQLYYDSAVQSLDRSLPEYEEVSEKHQVLTALITNLVNIDHQDSMLRLARDEKFRNSTLLKIKEEEERLRREEEYRKNNPFDNPENFAGAGDQFGMPGGMPGGGPGGTGTQGGQVSSGLPFYNMVSKSKGQAEFNRIWGNRKLSDNWRISSIAGKERVEQKEEDSPDEEGESEGEEKVTKEKVIPKDIAKEDAKYFEDVPFSPEEQKEAEISMGESYFMAGAIYRDKLNEPEKARQLLEHFLSKMQDNPYRENALFLLVRLYKDKGDESRANRYLEQLKKEFPNSDFITIIENPEILQNEKKQVVRPEDRVNSLYEKQFNHYKAKEYIDAFITYNQAKKDFPGNSIEYKFEFIYGLCLADTGNIKEYIQVMRKIAQDYPGDDIGKLANERILAYNRIVVGESDSEDPEQNVSKDKNIPVSLYKVNKEEAHHFIYKLPENMDVNKVKLAFSDFNNEFREGMNLQVANTFLSKQERVILITGFETLKDAQQYREDMLINKKIHEALRQSSDPKNQILISKSNFSILLKEKKWDEYVVFFANNYL
jgi:tetratricopeptide (TPR) repeat protein